MSFNCCQYYNNIGCYAECGQITLEITDLPVGNYEIEYWYNYSNYLHKFDVEVFDEGILILPNIFNYNYVYFKIKDVLTDDYYCLTQTILDVDTPVCCYVFNNINFDKKSIKPIENCEIDKNFVSLNYAISDYYNTNLRYINICDIEIDLEDFGGTIYEPTGELILDSLFNRIISNTALINLLLYNNITFIRTSTLSFEVLADKYSWGCCCESPIRLYTEQNYLLYGSQYETYCCNNTFNPSCVDGGRTGGFTGRGTIKIEVPLQSNSVYRIGTDCNTPLIEFSNYNFPNYESFAEYLNIIYANSFEFEAFDDSLIVYFKNFRCALIYKLCIDNVETADLTVLCCS